MERPTFEDLYREHYRLAWYAIRKSGVRRPAVIEELVHDVFLVVHRQMAELDQHKGSIRGWIYRISVYVALNHLSLAHLRREDLTDHTVQEETLRTSGDTEARIAAREHLRLLLEGMTPERREVYELAEVEGFTLPEIAAALNIPRSAADYRLRQARRDIKAAEARLRLQKAGRRLAILPFGTGAWLHLGDTVEPPVGASDRVWERVQMTIRAQGDGAGDSPLTPGLKPGKRPWRQLAWSLAGPALGPIAGAVVGAAAALIYADMMQTPPRVVAVRFPVVVVQKAELQTTAPETEHEPEEESAALPSPGGGGDPGKAANPAAVLALRKAQTAYMMGDEPGALAALSAFDGELSGDPLRRDAARLRALMSERDEGVR